MQNNTLSLEEIAEQGAEFYFAELKDTLERTSMGKYVVIDVEHKRYKIGVNQLKTIEEARIEFGEKLFFIVHIGDLKKPTNRTRRTYAWHF